MNLVVNQAHFAVQNPGRWLTRTFDGREGTVKLVFFFVFCLSMYLQNVPCDCVRTFLCVKGLSSG